MKQNKIVWLQIATMAGCVLLGIICFYNINKSIHKSTSLFLGYDIYLRRNEISCMHKGIDPFDIFERKIESEEFCGYPRPDMPEEPINGRRIVHSYPPWQMAVFWWYGYVPEGVCMAIMIGLYLCSLVWACIWTSGKMREPDLSHRILAILVILAMTLYPLANLCWTLNYGLFLLGCSLLLYEAIEHKHDILASVFYSFIMIKPQIGVLFLLPLFFSKHYKTIAVAGAICIAETLFIAWQLNKSPIELILQIPQIGAPFHKGFFASIAERLFGGAGVFLSMGFFLVIIATGCFLVRNADEVWVRFLPTIAFVPFWTYSWNHDWCVLLPCYIYLLNNKQRHPLIFNLCLLLAVLWEFSIFIYEKHWRILGDHRPSTPLFLLLLSSICFIVISDNKEKWDLNVLKLKRWDSQGK